MCTKKQNRFLASASTQLIATPGQESAALFIRFHVPDIDATTLVGRNYHSRTSLLSSYIFCVLLGGGVMGSSGRLAARKVLEAAV